MKADPIVQKALAFAEKAHDGQLRKGTDTPYIVHPREVARILEEAGCTPEVVCAGLLHDTVEDTEVTLKLIEQEFGSRIAAIVSWCTENKAGTWEERKQHTVALLRSGTLSHDTVMVIFADKLANLRSLERDYQEVGEKLWKRFRRPKEAQRWYYGAVLESMADVRDIPFDAEYREVYGRVFGRDGC